MSLLASLKQSLVITSFERKIALSIQNILQFHCNPLSLLRSRNLLMITLSFWDYPLISPALNNNKMKDDSKKPGKQEITYNVPAEGSLGLLALGYRGLEAWRKAQKDKEKARNDEHKKS
jgi:hypothetical protein